MFNPELYYMKRYIEKQIAEIMLGMSANILFTKNKDEEHFSCYSCYHGKIDNNIYIRVNELNCDIVYNGIINWASKCAFRRWFSMKGKNLFMELYELLKPLSSSEQLDFNLYYYV